MKTHTNMLSSLAIAALATVTFNPSEAVAKGGMDGMRSFSVARPPGRPSSSDLPRIQRN